jgi:hypothetical protein
MTDPTVIRERSRAVIAAEDLAETLESVNGLLRDLDSAAHAIKYFAEGGGLDAGAYRSGAVRLKALERLVERHVHAELVDLLGELDHVYGVSAEVKW